MPHVLIQYDRGDGWQTRQEGDADITADALADLLPGYSLQFPHRAYLDGNLVASSEIGRNGRVKVIRHDQ